QGCSYYSVPPNPVTIADADGTVYSFSNKYSASWPNNSFVAYADWVEDRNGNQETITTAKTGGGFTITDTAGRAAISASGIGQTGNTVTVAGLSNPYTLDWETVTADYSVDYQQVSPPSGACSGYVTALSTSYPAVSSITLPNNQQYQFQYYNGTYGLIEKVIYPTGGYVRYVWGVNAESTFGAFQDSQ